MLHKKLCRPVCVCVISSVLNWAQADRSIKIDLLVILAFVLCDVELCVKVVQQGVSTLLTERVVHVCLTWHDVKQVTGHLNEKQKD